MQIIYGGKTTKSIPIEGYPNSFCIRFDEMHYSNEEGSLKFLKYVIRPDVERERNKLSKPQQAVLVIMDVFKGQMTEVVQKNCKKKTSY